MARRTSGHSGLSLMRRFEAEVSSVDDEPNSALTADVHAVRRELRLRSRDR